MKYTLIFGGLISASQLSASEPSLTPKNEMIYRQGGEWETVTEVVDLIIPNASESQRQLVLKLYREKFGNNTSDKQCLDTLQISEYPKPGSQLNLNTAGMCMFEQVEQPGEPVQRVASCGGENLASKLFISGYHSPSRYEYLMEMESTSGSAVTAITKESGTLLGPCTVNQETE